MGTFSQNPRLSHLSNTLTRKLDELEGTVNGEDIDEMTAASQLDGTEKLAGVQSGSPRSFTTEQLGGDALQQALGTSRGYRRYGTTFQNFRRTKTLTAPNDVEEGVYFRRTNDGELSKSNPTFGNPSGVQLSTHGTSTAQVSGCAGIELNMDLGFGYNNFGQFMNVGDINFRVGIGTQDAWAGSGNSQTYVGLLPTYADNEPSRGAYFYTDSVSGDDTDNVWRCAYKNGTVTLSEDTTKEINNAGVFSGDFDVLELDYNSTTGLLIYYINGDKVWEVDTTDTNQDFTLFNDANQGYYAVKIRKITIASEAKSTVYSMHAVDQGGPNLSSADLSDL